jgi:hypothetical protein
MLGQEPRNGDFVAYIDELQRQSAARMRAQSHTPLDAGTARPSKEHDEAHTPAALTRRQVEEMMTRLARQRASRGAGAGPVLAIGIALILAAAVFDLGAVPLLAGIVLVLWSIVRRIRSARAPADASAQAQLGAVFGPRPRA